MFERFLKFRKENGDDIDSWQKEELKVEVEQFKKFFGHSLDFQKILEETRNAYSKSISKRILFFLNPLNNFPNF